MEKFNFNELVDVVIESFNEKAMYNEAAYEKARSALFSEYRGREYVDMRKIIAYIAVEKLGLTQGEIAKKLNRERSNTYNLINEHKRDRTWGYRHRYKKVAAKLNLSEYEQKKTAKLEDLRRELKMNIEDLEKIKSKLDVLIDENLFGDE